MQAAISGASRLAQPDAPTDSMAPEARADEPSSLLLSGAAARLAVGFALLATPSEGAVTIDAAKIVRAAIPLADDATISHVLWARTAYPFCGPEDFARKLYRAASRWARACAKRTRLCELCDRIARPGAWDCQECADALERNRAETREGRSE